MTPVRPVTGFPSAPFRMPLKWTSVGTAGLEDLVVDWPAAKEGAVQIAPTQITAVQVDAVQMNDKGPASNLTQHYLSPSGGYTTERRPPTVAR